jgi:hypothetical protein
MVLKYKYHICPSVSSLTCVTWIHMVKPAFVFHPETVHDLLFKLFYSVETTFYLDKLKKPKL